jgi:hypothetical protein
MHPMNSRPFSLKYSCTPICQVWWEILPRSSFGKPDLPCFLMWWEEWQNPIVEWGIHRMLLAIPLVWTYMFMVNLEFGEQFFLHELPWSTSILATSWLAMVALMINGNFSLGGRQPYQIQDRFSDGFLGLGSFVLLCSGFLPVGKYRR